MIKTAIILAGGLGTRLRPLTLDIPKPMILVQDKPLLQHIIESLKFHNITNIILSIGYKSEKVKEYFNDGKGFGVKISYVVEEEPLGTGGAIKQASKNLKEPFFLLWGDGLLDVNFIEMSRIFINQKPDILMGLLRRDDAVNYSIVEIEDDKNIDRYNCISKITRFVEKPKHDLNNSKLMDFGVYILEPNCLDILPEGKSSIEFDCFEKIVSDKSKNILAYLHKGQWFPTDDFKKYQFACKNFVSRFDNAKEVGENL